MSWARGVGGLLSAVLVLLAGAFLVVIVPTPASACECKPISRDEAAESADVIMYGTVRSIDRISDTDPIEYQITLDVESVYKGLAYTEQLVQTPDPGSGCGLAPEPGVNVVIFATERDHADDGHSYELLSTTCDGNVVTNTPPRELGHAYPPQPGSSADVGSAERMDASIVRAMVTIGLVLVGIVIVGGAALIWLWRPGRAMN